MNELKINEVKFGIAGAIISFIAVLLIEIFLWIRFVPSYNQLTQAIYGVSQTSQIIQVFIISLIVMIIAGFALSWLFAKIYNKLLVIKIRVQ